MAGNKTRRTTAPVSEFIDGIEDEAKRDDAREMMATMTRLTGEEPAMWGTSIVGFGDHHYRYQSGREGDWFRVGFSPRKRDLTIYFMSGLDGCDDLLSRLGRYSTGKSCLYVKRLDDVDRDVLEELIGRAYAATGG